MNGEIISINTANKLAIYEKNLRKKLEYKKRIDKAIRTLEILKGSARWERHLYEIDALIDILRGETNGSNK